MQSRFFVVACLCFLPGLAHSAPTSNSSRKAPTPSISVEPAAKAVLVRAAKLYGAAPRWSGQILSFNSLDSERSKISLAFVRPQFIRIENRYPTGTLFEMADGKTVSSYVKDSALGSHSTRKVQMRTFAEILGDSIASPKASGELLAALLQGRSGIPQSATELKRQHLRSFRVKSLPSGTWRGIQCTRIKIEKHYAPDDEGETSAPTWFEHWFTAEGKLVQSLVSAMGDPTVKDELFAQNFAPTFGPEIFKFTPPKEKLPDFSVRR